MSLKISYYLSNNETIYAISDDFEKRISHKNCLQVYRFVEPLLSMKDSFWKVMKLFTKDFGQFRQCTKSSYPL